MIKVWVLMVLVNNGHWSSSYVPTLEFESNDFSDFVPPDWFGEEVTGRKEYANAYMFKQLKGE